MSAKSGYPFKGHKSPGVFTVAGSFTTAGASAPTVITGAGFSVSAPTAAGVYTITLTDGTFAGVISKWISLEVSTLNSANQVRYGSVSGITTAGTFTIVTASAAGTDAQLTGPVVSFGLELRDSTATR